MSTWGITNMATVKSESAAHMDRKFIGAGFELSRNKFWANMTLIGSVLLTILLWLYIWKVRG